MDNEDGVILLGAEVMRDRRKAVTTGGAKGNNKGEEYSEKELKRFAQTVIDERIKFCKEKKEKIKDTDIDECACEAIIRWIRLFKDSPMKGSVMLGKLRVDAVEKLFEEMKKDGRIKCPQKKEI